MEFTPKVRFTKNLNDILNALESSVEKELVEQLRCECTNLHNSGITDNLTCLYNKKKFNEDIDFLYSQVNKPADVNLSLLVVDLDKFKNINDTLGHDKGDIVLKWTAKSIQACLRDREGYRESSRVYRYGGEEFCILLPKTNLDTGYLVAERIRKSLHENSDGKVTASIGVANSSDKECDSPLYLFQKADHAVYKAKDSGRNRVVLSGVDDSYCIKNESGSKHDTYFPHEPLDDIRKVFYLQ
jgi:diguanylate cyclase (GGDEF)-like protein